MRTRLLVTGGLVALLFAGAGCGNSTHSAKGSASSSKPGQSVAGQQHGGKGAAQQKPDLSGIPAVVARVNGQPITRSQFAQTYSAEYSQVAAQQQQQSGGSPIDQEKLKKQTVSTLVGTELLVQEAHRKGMTASNQAIEQTLQRAAQQDGMKTTSQLMAALRKQGMTAQQVRSQAGTQILTNEVVSAEAGSTTPTEQELQALYHRLVAQQQQQAGGQKTKTPPFSQVKAQLAQQLKSQKQQAATQKLVERLRQNAKVTINM